MTEPSLVPVENRLRSTFGARAEDMAPGDAGEADPLPPLALTPAPERGPERRFRRPTRPLLAAAAVLVVALAAAAVAVLAARDGGSDDVATADPAGASDWAIVDLVIAPRDLIDALEAERDLALVELIGAEDVLVLPESDAGVVRPWTDSRIAKFRALVADSPAGSAYGPAIDRLDGLQDLRDEIDNDPGTRDLQNTEYAEHIASEYEDLVGGLLDAQRELVLGIDDPELRRGGVVYQRGLQQRDLIAQLVRGALLSAIEYRPPEGHTELARRQDAVEHGQDELLAEATGSPYEDAVVTIVGEIDDSGLLEITAPAVEGTVDVAGLLSAVELPDDGGWPDFLDRVERLLVNER